MARYNGAGEIYDVAAQFRRRCMASGHSLLWPDSAAWTVDNIDSLYAALFKSPIHGNDQTFNQKFQRQLANLNDEAVRVACDAHAMFYLYSSPDDINPATKRKIALEVISWRFQGETDPPYWSTVSAAYGTGIGSVGPFYKQNKPAFIGYLLQLARELRLQPERASDDEFLIESADAVQRRVPFSISARHSLLHMLCPDRFERIVSGQHRTRIADVFRYIAPDAGNEDRALLDIRQHFVDTLSQSDFDFYDTPDVHERWSNDELVSVGKRMPENGRFRFTAEAFLADSIQRCHSIAEKNWCVTARRDLTGIQLNAGCSQVVYLDSAGMWVGIHTDDAQGLLENVGADRLMSNSDCGAIFKCAPEIFGVQVHHTDADELLPILRSSHEKMLSTAAARSLLGDWSKAHNPAVIDLLRLDLRRRVPQPGATEPNRFLFQANPGLYDLGATLRSTAVGATNSWIVTRLGGEMRPGDRLLLWQGGPRAGIYAIGTLTSEPYDRLAGSFWPEGHKNAGKPERAVGYKLDMILSAPILKQELLSDPVLSELTVVKSPQATNYRITEDQWNAVVKRLNLPTPILQSLVARTHMPAEDLLELRDLIEDKKQLILEGPPGAGKTYLADYLARWVADVPLDEDPDGQVELVQFHQSYGYEDFVQGLRPRTVDGAVVFEVVDGIFLDLCKRAAADPERPYVLIIDEINRGNLSRIFGELLMALEYRDRPVRLPYGKDPLRIPENLYLIGTMNSTDRSLALIDYALRRRFYFHRLLPVENGAAGVYGRWLAANVDGPARDRLHRLFVSLNQELVERLSPDFQVGHSYFMRGDIHTDAGLRRVWKHAVTPLLQEYFHSSRDRAGSLDHFTIERLLGLPGRGSARDADANAYADADADTPQSFADAGEPE